MGRWKAKPFREKQSAPFSRKVKMMKKNLFVLGLAGGLLLSGCVEERFDLDPDGVLLSGSVSPTFSIPIGEVSVQVTDALSKLDSAGISSAVNNNAIEIFKAFSVLDTTANEWLRLDEFSWSDNFEMPFDVPAGQSASFPVTLDMPLPSGVVVDSMQFAQGSLAVVPGGDLPMDGLMHLNFLEFQQSGVSFNFAVGAGAENQTLNNIRYIEDGSPGVSLMVTIDSGVSGFSAGDQVSLALTFAIDEVDWVVGEMPGVTFGEFNHELPMEALDGLDPGVVHVSAPRIELEAVNGLGLIIQAEISQASYGTIVGEAPISGPQIQDIPDMPAAVDMFDLVPGVWFHSLDNDGTNPTIGEVIESSPEYIRLNGSVQVSAESESGFVLRDAPLRLSGRIVLPLEGWVNDYVLRDTVALHLDEVFNEHLDGRASWSDVESITLRMLWQNDLPLDVRPLLAFQDSTGAVLSTWYDGADAFTLVPAGSSELVDVVIHRDDLAALEPLEVRNLAWSAIFSTPNAPEEVVAVAADAKLGLRLGLEIQLDANLNE
jgi:hypothetical protein